jgi:hypothetical protein
MTTTDSDAWLESFSLRTYQPMVRLAAGSDPAWLSGAHTSDRVRRYRREQRSLLREYLRGLLRDFQMLHSIAAAKERADQYSDRGLELCDGQLSFIFSVLWIEACLAVQAVFPQAIDMSPLLESVDELARATREMARSTLRLYFD